ncbi:IS701 family transposase [Kitasatospora sp. NPDC056327]|uniref:IS701 family transposase n=1 Tax=Kitasatospora sp. NPDC056327 TaxID=3345785 RepID=UPI0035DEF8BB
MQAIETGARTINGDSPAGLAEEAFSHLHRADQRRWACAYLTGLLSVDGKKSLREMARVIPSVTNATYGLQQFINSSPWDWMPARDKLAVVADRRMPVRAWTAGILSIPKRGAHSVGVHRRFLPQLGRAVNCQVAAGLFLSSEEESIPVDWTLFLDESWDGAENRRRARIPASVGPQPLCMNVLELVDVMLGRFPGSSLPLVADLRTATNISRLALELGLRGVEFVVEVAPTQPVLPTARPRAVGSAPQPKGVSTAAAVCDPDPRHPGATVSAAVRLPGADLGVTAERTYRLLSRRTPAGRGRYWITGILDRPAAEVLALARHQGRADRVLRELELDYGVNDFEGRSYPGWHHHMTMVSAAYLYRNLLDPGGRGRAARWFDAGRQYA